MNYTRIHFESDISPALHFQTGVSLHGHTLHSKESLDFIYRLARNILPVRVALERGQERYKRFHGSRLDLTRAWWTPPLSAHQAWALEAGQIEKRFEMRALVSLSDHDDIDAPMSLQLLEECRPMPVSVEWTVPYRATFFHIGVHNIPGANARRIMSDLAAFTADPNEAKLRELFAMLAADPHTLIVFNHPHWDEKGIGRDAHRETARQFATAYKPFLHAFELNGLRPWSENRTILDLARAFDKPVISGGDRHATEPNTLLNLTNTTKFAEFVEEVRDGVSDVLITNQYLEPLSMRILHSVEEVLAHRPEHAYGWKNWGDRAFYVCDDGVVRSLAETWGQEPLAVRLFTGGVEILRHPKFKQTFRAAFARREQVVL